MFNYNLINSETTANKKHKYKTDSCHKKSILLISFLKLKVKNIIT